MRIPMLALMIATVATPAMAQQDLAAAGQPPERIRSVAIQRGEPCPKAVGDEVVVCTTIVEPYRIPQTLRRQEPSAANQSWVNRTAYADQLGRAAAGLPNTCSVIGSGGATGCATAAARAYGAEKRANARAAESVPGAEGSPIIIPAQPDDEK